MPLSIDPRIFEKFPGTMIGVIEVHGVNNTGTVPAADLAESAAAVQHDFAQYVAPSRHPHLLAWRHAYKKFGCDPHQYRCSAEALVRQILKGNAIWGINPLVDIYNYISLKYVVPVGGEDLSKMSGDVQLTFALGTEPFVRLGGEDNEPPDPGEVIYKDDVGVLCRRWNWREAERTKLSAATTDALIVIDALPPMTRSQVEQASLEFADLIQRYCGGTSTCQIMTAT